MDNLTFGDIFKIFPRLPSVKTPEVNRKIIVPSGITPLKNADQFRVIYKEGKQLQSLLAIGNDSDSEPENQSLLAIGKRMYMVHEYKNEKEENAKEMEKHF